MLKVKSKILLTEASPRVDVRYTSLLKLSLTVRKHSGKCIIKEERGEEWRDGERERKKERERERERRGRRQN